MRIRAKANGNILDSEKGDISEDSARELLKTGIYEEIDETDQPVVEDKAVEAKKEPKGYKRRDLRAEE